jgi:hypothetical protein
VLHLLAYASLLFLIVSTVWLVVPRTPLFPVPVWSLILLGFFAGFGFLMMPIPFNFYLVYFLLVILGLGCARSNGPSAGLVVLMGGIIAASAAIEPGMYLKPGTWARILLSEGVLVLFTIFTPILVLRARSTLGQAVWLLFPLVAYSAVFIFALTGASGLAFPMFQFSIDRAASVASPFIVLIAILAVAVAVYAWISSIPASAPARIPPAAQTSP